METGLILNALEMAIWSRGERLDGLVGYSDAGSQYTSNPVSTRPRPIHPSNPQTLGSVSQCWDAQGLVKAALAATALGLM